MKRLIALVAVLLALLPVQVFAIADPDTLTINNAWAYRHLLETGDQLYLIDFTIEYAANPTETASDAFIVRLMDGATELLSTTPYAYFDDGYARGVAGLYFSAADAPVWAGAYDIQVMGNPLLAWGGAIPDTTMAVANWSASTSLALTSGELASRVLILAQTLETNWSIDLIESAGGGGNQLTSYGEAYFTTVIYELATICPQIFSIQIYEPAFPAKTFGQSYATALANDVVGTPLDMSDLATKIGVSTMWVSGALYAVVCVALLILVGRGTGSSKATTALLIPCIIVGALLGIIPLVAAIMMGFIAGLLVLWSLFGGKASA